MSPKFLFDIKSMIFDAKKDPLDFRDRLYVPTLVEVPIRIDLDKYKEAFIPILNQGNEGACTGFGLTTVVNPKPVHAPSFPWFKMGMKASLYLSRSIRIGTSTKVGTYSRSLKSRGSFLASNIILLISNRNLGDIVSS